MSCKSSFKINGSGMEFPRLDNNICEMKISDIEYNNKISSDSIKLTEFVRKHYLNYLKRLLQENYSYWKTLTANDIELTTEDITTCAEYLELEAVESCMILHLYRTTVLNMVSDIKSETKLCLLHSKLLSAKAKNNYSEVAIQTEDVQCLDDKIKVFEERFINRKRKLEEDVMEVVTDVKNYFENPGEQATTPTTCSASDSKLTPDNCELEQKLEAIFGGDEVGDIFEEFNNKPEIEAIINEIEKFEPTRGKLRTVSVEDCGMIFSENAEKVAIEDKTPNIADVKISEELAAIIKLKNSVWPSELHLQTINLRALLNAIAEIDYRDYEKIQQKFRNLFGEDEEDFIDELGPYSPTPEDNEIILWSSRKRIVNYIVNLLMPYLNDKVIASRDLFKKVAKRISDAIFQINNFAETEFMDIYVQTYFAEHSTIETPEDIT